MERQELNKKLCDWAKSLQLRDKNFTLTPEFFDTATATPSRRLLFTQLMEKVRPKAEVERIKRTIHAARFKMGRRTGDRNMDLFEALEEAKPCPKIELWKEYKSLQEKKNELEHTNCQLRKRIQDKLTKLNESVADMAKLEKEVQREKNTIIHLNLYLNLSLKKKQNYLQSLLSCLEDFKRQGCEKSTTDRLSRLQGDMKKFREEMSMTGDLHCCSTNEENCPYRSKVEEWINLGYTLLDIMESISIADIKDDEGEEWTDPKKLVSDLMSSSGEAGDLVTREILRLKVCQLSQETLANNAESVKIMNELKNNETKDHVADLAVPSCISDRGMSEEVECASLSKYKERLQQEIEEIRRDNEKKRKRVELLKEITKLHGPISLQVEKLVNGIKALKVENEAMEEKIKESDIYGLKVFQGVVAESQHFKKNIELWSPRLKVLQTEQVKSDMESMMNNIASENNLNILQYSNYSGDLGLHPFTTQNDIIKAVEEKKQLQRTLRNLMKDEKDKLKSDEMVLSLVPQSSNRLEKKAYLEKELAAKLRECSKRSFKAEFAELEYLVDSWLKQPFRSMVEDCVTLNDRSLSSWEEIYPSDEEDDNLYRPSLLCQTMFSQSINK